jgi:hypothetical protein
LPFSGYPAMSDDNPHRRGWSAWAVPLVFALPLLYVALFGPAILGMVRLATSGNPAAAKVASVMMLPYIPLVMLGNQFEMVGDALDWYVQVFSPGVELFTPPPLVLPGPGTPAMPVP